MYIITFQLPVYLHFFFKEKKNIEAFVCNYFCTLMWLKCWSYFSLQTANMEFCQAKASDQSGAQREAMLKDLAAGFDMFMELKSNLEEGTKVNYCNLPVTTLKNASNNL